MKQCFRQVSGHYNDSLRVFMHIKNFLLIQFCFLSCLLRRAVHKYAVPYIRHVQPYMRMTFKPLNIANFVANFHEI